MTTQDLKNIVLKLNEISWHERDVAKAYEHFYAEEIVFHRPPFPPVRGKEANRQSDEGMLTAFSDTKSTVHEVVAEGHTVTAHWTWQAIHTGNLPNLGVPATGKCIKFSGCSIYHFRDGKITEQWEYGDLLGFMQQLGVIPVPG